MSIHVLGNDKKRKIPEASAAYVNSLRQRYFAARERTRRWHSIIRDCYDFCIPNRNNVDKANKDGQERTQKVVDGTAVEALYGFANELQSSLIPADTSWVRMKPGIATKEQDISDASEALDYWTGVVFEDIHNSNFSSAAHEALLDVGIGTGAIRVIGGDVKQRLIYETIPLVDIVVEEGPYGTIENVYFPKTVKASMIKRRWPFAEFDADTAEMVKNSPDAMVDLVECCVYDVTYAAYRTVVFVEKTAKAIFQSASDESEYAVFRWAVAPGEIMGRGVAMSALPFIRVLNRSMRLTVSISELAIAGMYTGVGDGIFNPHNVVFKPGAIFPTEDPDAGLKPIAQSHDFQISQELMSEWRMRIRAIMFQEEAAPLVQGTQPSATAAILRSERLQAKIGGSFPRLFRELVSPLFKKSVFQLQLLGRLPADLKLNGHDVDIQYVGPLAQASRMDQVKSVQSAIEVVAGLLGPEMVHAGFKSEEIPRFIGEGFGVPDKLMRSPKEVEDTIKMAVGGQAAAAAGQGAGQPQAPGGPTSPPTPDMGPMPGGPQPAAGFGG